MVVLEYGVFFFLGTSSESSSQKMVGKRTKVLVPVGTDSDGQLRLTTEALQKAILMVTKGGQVENLPQGGLIINNSNSVVQTRISENSDVMVTNVVNKEDSFCPSSLVPAAWPKVENLSQGKNKIFLDY